ncbi:MAG: flagellar hook assembly protein FlgD [Thiohalospira sp.]
MKPPGESDGKDRFEEMGLTGNRPEKSRSAEEGDNAKVGQEDFLKLMLAQIENQDPMKPTENGEFLSQMATFSQAQGMKELTDTFTELAENLTSNQALQASSMIGRQVMIESKTAGFDGERPVQGALELDSSGQEVTVSVQNSAGEKVKELDIGQVTSGRHSFTWDGTDEEGNPVPPGSYEISAEGKVGGETRSLNTLLSTQVESVSMGKGGQGVKLNLSGGETLDLQQVREIM